MKYYFDWKEEIKKEELNIAIETIKNDGLILTPTETVYGIAASAYSNQACKKIFIAKGRMQDNPLIVHVCDKKMIYEIAEEPNEIEEKLIESFMPGPFTSANMKTIGVRMPSNKIIHDIIQESQIPLAAPSANISGRPSGTCVEDVLPELKDKIDIVIDGGKCRIGLESTVVKVIDGVPTILRPGFVTEQDIKKKIGCVKISDNLFKKIEKDEKVESPGMKYRHYAPKTKCILVECGEKQIEKINELIKENRNTCVLGFIEDRKLVNVEEDRFISLGSKENLLEISQNIFSSLRKIDMIENCDLAIIEGVEKEGLGLSIMNRLVRACENNVK